MNAPTTTLTKPKSVPTKFTPQTRRKILRLVEIGVPLSHIPAALGFSWSWFCHYRSQHPKFQAAIERARSRSIERHLRIIQTAAQNGDVASSRWFLERSFPEHFARNRIELTGADGSPLALGVSLYLPQKQGETPAPTVITAAPRANEIGN